MITIEQLWSRFLFNQNQAPIGDALLDEKYIRNSDLENTKGDVVEISASEFQNKYGKFVKANDFRGIERFFETENNGIFSYQELLKQVDKNPNLFVKDSLGVISFDLKILFNMSLNLTNIDKPNEQVLLSESVSSEAGQKTIKQSDFIINGESAYDYAVRVQMFQTTGFVIGNSKVSSDGKFMEFDPSVRFYVNPDNTRYIENFSIQPTPNLDNFDFTGGGSDIDFNGIAQSYVNNLNKIMTDPNNIGRTVPIHYVDDISGRNYNLSAYNYDKNRTNDFEAATILDNAKFLIGLKEIYANLYEDNVTSFKDSEGRFVGYGTSESDITNLTNWRFNEYNRLNDLSVSVDGSKGVAFVASDGNDKIRGTDSNDKILGGGGEDTLKGEDGDDVLYAGDKENDLTDTNRNYLYGGSDNDKLYGGGGKDELYGGAGDDLLFGSLGDDELYGGEGDDYIHGANGRDVLVGNGGNDYIYGNEGDDVLHAGDGGSGFTDRGGENDYLYGGDGNDTLIYSASVLFGGEGRLEGGKNFDTYKTAGNVTVNDEDGKGILYYQDKNLLGAEMRYKSNTLSKPSILDFSKSGYDINDKSTGRLVEIARTEKYVRYIVDGDINFKHKGLKTEGLDNGELGIKFYVTVYKDIPPPPPPFHPPYNPPTRSDPLILDLNHDGQINTVGLGSGVFFDLDGNHFAEKTSWVTPQDGFVVLDLNNNGNIDNGGELFGTDTLLENGNKAADGFQALAQYDKNQDKIINDQDQVYQQLKIWKDINQDGISQENELFSLSDLSITSVSVNQQAIDVKDVNNVVHTNQATFTQQVLENGILTSKIGKAETLLFEISTSNTVWQGAVEGEEGIEADILTLPNFPGYGSVTSLHTAMANDTTGTLKALVSQFASTPTEDQLALTHQILLHWTNNQNISSLATTYPQAGMSKQQFEILKALWGKEAEWNGWPPHHSAARELEGFYQKVLASAYSQLMLQTSARDWVDFIAFKEEKVYQCEIILAGSANGSGGGRSVQRMTTFDDVLPPSMGTPWQYIYSIWHADFGLAIEQLTSLFLMSSDIGKAEIEKFHIIVMGLDPNNIVLYQELLEQFTLKAQEITDENLRNLLLESVYAQDDNLNGKEQNDVIKTFGGNDSIAAFGGDDFVYGDNGDDVVYGGAGNDHLDGGVDNDKIYGDIGDDILVGGQGDDYLDGGVGNDTYIFSLGDGQDIIQSSENNFNKLDRIVFKEGITVNDVSLLRQDYDLIIKYSEQDQITVKNYFDINGETAFRIDQIVFVDGIVWNVDYIKQKLLIPTELNDIIQGYNSEDELIGLAGNDNLYGHAGNDTLIGGIGDDYLYGGVGNDILIGSTGNDYLEGGVGNDRYIFNLGDGQDIILNNPEYNYNKIDQIILAQGILQEDVSVQRESNNLIVKYSNQDQIKVLDYFDVNGATKYGVEGIVFNNGVVWDANYIKTQVLIPTLNNDIIQGYNTNDQLFGLDGNDNLQGNYGNDTLIGGVGSDILSGGDGSDNYYFSKGDGKDFIYNDYNYYYNINKLDRVFFDDSVTPEDLIIKRQGGNLSIQYSDQDQIIVNYYFDAYGVTNNRIDQIIFNNGMIWTVEDIKTKVSEATAGNNDIHGYAGNDEISGLGGNDNLYGNDGNDILIGGTGNDYLDGGNGSDHYIFNIGDGQDVVFNTPEYNYNKFDKIIFAQGVLSEDVIVQRKGNDLILKYSDQDQITVKYYFDNESLIGNKLDQIVFDNGEIWSVEKIKSKVLFGTAIEDSLSGYDSDDYLRGLDGNDILCGEYGDDILDGGIGNDYLNGGRGNDTYIFSQKFGHDIIYNYDDSQNHQDVIQFMDGLVKNDFNFRREDGGHLIIQTKDFLNSVTVERFFENELENQYLINQIKFSDNITLDVRSIKDLVLQATNGNDKLYAYTSGSVLSGLAGDDALYGGAGNDTYIFSTNWGDDFISDISINNIMKFQEINPDSLNFYRDGYNLIIYQIGTNNKIKIYDQFSDLSETTESLKIQKIIFDNGIEWDTHTIKQKAVIGTNTDNTIYGFSEADQIYGNDGNDLLYGLNGDDNLVGGIGNDTLIGDMGKDTYEFSGRWGQDTIVEATNDNIVKFNGIGSDSIYLSREGSSLVISQVGTNNKITVYDQFYNQSGNTINFKIQNIVFDNGVKWDAQMIRQKIMTGTNTDNIIYGFTSSDIMFGYDGNDRLYGDDGADILHGGSGNDVLIGGDDHDTYIFSTDWGQDLIDERDVNNTIYFTSIDSNSIYIYREDSSLIIYQLNTENKITIYGQFFDSTEHTESLKIQNIVFDNGVEWDAQTIKQKAVIGTSENNTIYGFADADQIYGGLGDDNLFGVNNDDQLYGGLGNDVLQGDFGADQLFGDEGDDTLIGSLGNDTLNGGVGNDILNGGANNDTYVFRAGWGQDIIQSNQSGTAQDIDTLHFNGITPSEILVRNIHGNMVIQRLGSDDQITIEQQFNLSYGLLININQIIFSDGTVWDSAKIQTIAIQGTDTNDVIESVTNNDVIYAGAGDDIVYGNSPSYSSDNYQIYGGLGNDKLYANGLLDGGTGDDILDGNGTLSGGIGNDQLNGSGVLNGDDGDDIIWGNGHFDGGSGNDEITLDHFEMDSYLVGGDGNDTLSGSDDRIHFINNIANFIETEDGYYPERDTSTLENERVIYFEGGKGNDNIYGTFGEDIYLFNLGDGQDTIVERRLGENYSNVALSYDILRFGEGIASTDIVFERVTNDLKIKHVNGTDTITIENYFVGPNGHYKIEEIQFNDGTIFDQAYIENHVYIYGSSSDDTIWGASGHDTIFAGAGDDHIQSKEGNDKIFGEEGNDGIFGEAGDDYIDGGLGDDYIDGGLGNDIYVFNKGDGTDTYSFNDNLTAINSIKLIGYTTNDVFAQKQGNSVYLSFKGTDDHIWLSNYYVADTATTTYRMDQIIFDSGTIWTSTDIDTLVNRALNNHAPTVNAAIPMITSNQGAIFSYKFASNVIIDQDSWDSLSYKITLTTKDSNGQYQPIPSWLTFDPATQTLSGTPPSNVTGNLSFFYWGTDMYGLGTGTSFTLKVNPPNQAPIVLNAIADQSFTDAKAFSYTISSTAFKDPDGDALTYTATLEDGSALPSWLTFNAATRVLSGTAPESTAPLNIKIIAKDTANQSVSDIFKVSFVVQNLTLSGTSSADTLYGGSGNDTITGLAGNDILYGQSGNDTLDGGAGNDTLYGGKGNDIYVVDSISDSVNENASEGIDTVQSSVTYTLSNANVENLTLTGTSAISGTGNALNNVLTGNSANNTLTGGAGNDTLNGGAGTDILIGGLGDDLYIINSTTNTLTENTNEGTDTVQSSVTYSLGNNLENLILTGTSAINGTGNLLNNTITGNSAGNTLSGGAGADTLIGGLGDDIYVIDNTSDIVTENTSEGTDSVQSSVTYGLSANVENLTLTGTTAINGTGNELNNVLTGNSANNTLIGGAGNDTFNGGAGTDTLIGGLGDDLYVIDSTTDTLTENANEGTDTVQSSVTYTLGNNIENLTLTGTTAINATGNALNNILIGNSAVNTLTGGAGDDYLDGGAGNDKLLGGLGNDTYVVDSTSDTITENTNEGIDTIRSSVTLTLGNNLENLTLTGTSAINGTGNTLNNTLIGNTAVNTLTGGAGDDYLDGGTGADKLLGGTGNDSYVIDNTGDVVTENTNEGIDTVLSSITYTLGNNLENLTLTGSTAINATGNTLNNTLIGNNGANVLNSGAGNDILDGQGGNDQYTGGTGADTLVYNLLVASDVLGGNGSDIWSDFTIGNTTTNANADKIDISDLLIDYAGDYSVGSLTPYLNTIVSGSNTQLYIDRDGGGSVYSSSLLLTLNNTNTSLNDLINNHQIV